MWNRKQTFFVILNLFRPVLWNGDVVLESCKFMSDLIMDQTHPLILQYESILSYGIKVSRRSGARVMSYSMELVSEEIFGPDGSSLSVGELLNTEQVGKHCVMGKIHFVMTDTNWCTTRCHRCKTDVPQTYSKVYCDVCCCYIVPNARYRLYVHVVGGTGGAVFVMYDDTAYELIGRTAEEVVSDILRVKAASSNDDFDKFDFSNFDFPGDIHMIIGKEYVFEVEVEPHHLFPGAARVYKVLQVTRCSTSPQLQLGSNSDDPDSESPNSSTDATMSG